MPGSAVVVHPAVTCPALTAANIVGASGNSRGAGSRQDPTDDGAWNPATAPTISPSQCFGSVLRSALTSWPPQALAVACVTSSTGLSSAAVA